MKEPNVVTETHGKAREITFNVLLIVLSASFPFSIRLSSILTVLLAATWLSSGYFRNIPMVFRSKYFLMFSLFFFIPALSLLYSENKDLSSLEKRFFLIVYPLVLFTSNIKMAVIKAILGSFAISCTVAALYSLLLTISNGEVLGTEMTRLHIGITHVYFGWYLTFTVIILGYFLINRQRTDYISVIFGIQILFVLFFLFALSSKMSIISLFVLVSLICIRFIIRTRRWILGAIILITPLAIFFITLKNFEVVYYRFYDLFNPENYFVGDNAWNSIGVRVSVLKCISETVVLAPFFGTGIGDVQYDLDNCYQHLGLTTVVGMNAHNQYLQLLLGTGLVSVVIFLAIFFKAVQASWRNNNRLYLFFICLFLLCSLTESLLERQHGTMFFAFFNSLLFLNVVKKKDVHSTL